MHKNPKNGDYWNEVLRNLFLEFLREVFLGPCFFFSTITLIGEVTI
jgi:hypothetical protein